MKKTVCRLILLCLALPVLLLLTGCENGNNNEPAEEEFVWDPSWGEAPEGMSTGSNGEGEEEIIRDTAFVVVEKRQAGGRLEPSGETSSFDGRQRMVRTPLESMIIVEGNMTGQRSAYLLPQGDYNTVQVGHRLQESTLGRWESTTENHIPPPPAPEKDENQRSRTGGAAEQFAY